MLTEPGRLAAEHYGLEEADSREDCLVVGRKGRVAVALLDRPKAGNALDAALSSELHKFWSELREDSDVRAVVLGSTTDRSFCTGIDVRQVSESGLPTNPKANTVTYRTARDADLWKPVVCAIEGRALGAGLSFIADADVVVAGEAATFFDTHVNIGLAAASENIGLAFKAGIGAALYVTLLGRGVEITAPQARQLGLVQEVVTPGTTAPRAMELATAISENSPSAVRKSLQALWSLRSKSYLDAHDYAQDLAREQFAHPDASEGPRAFAAHRSPQWTEA